MTDFVKVNFEFEEDFEEEMSKGEYILNKNNIRLFKYNDGNCWVYHSGGSLIITIEEYDRLCKELGIRE